MTVTIETRYDERTRQIMICPMPDETVRQHIASSRLEGVCRLIENDERRREPANLVLAYDSVLPGELEADANSVEASLGRLGITTHRTEYQES